jgi:nitric oxide synthase-interacting protein
VACPQGDLFCRECAVSNLLAQRKEIARLEKEWERRRVEEEEGEQMEDERERERAVVEFERVQMGLENKAGKKRKIDAGEDTREDGREAKRKFELSEEVERAAKEERKKMREELDAEKVRSHEMLKRMEANYRQKASTKNLPSFWVPSQTPNTEPPLSKDNKPPKLHSFCPSSAESDPHQYSLKTLTSVKFTTDSSSKSTARTCPACKKTLSNSTKGMLAVPCGHVLCKPCADKFLKPTEGPDPHNPDAEHGVVRCFVCDADLSGKAKRSDKKNSKKEKGGGLVELRCDGTGFAGGGKAVVQKDGVAFQC